MRMTVKRRIGLLGAAVVAAAGLPLVTGQSATADTIGHCYGVKVASRKLQRVDNTADRRGRVELWYDGRSGGTSCVMTYNKRKGRQVTVAKLKVGSGSWQRDAGRYRYYAGGVRKKRTNGKCVRFFGRTVIEGHSYVLNSAPRYPRTGNLCLR